MTIYQSRVALTICQVLSCNVKPCFETVTEMAVVPINVKLEWRAMRSASSSRWIGICDALNLSMEAESLDELHSLIPETIHLLMTDLFEENELDQYLRTKGWHAVNIPTGPVGDIEFDVPWYLVAEGARDFQRSTH